MQIVELDLGKNFKAKLPNREVVELWEKGDELMEFRKQVAVRVDGLLRAIPNPADLNKKEKWRNIRGNKVYELDFDGRKHDIKGVNRKDFWKESEKRGLALPIPTAIRDAYWKKLVGTSSFLPQFPVPLEADFERQLLIVRQNLQWYVDHCQSEENPQEPSKTTNSTEKHDKARSEEEVKIIKPEDAEILAIALVGEKAKRMVNEAQIEAGKITEIARREADEMLRNVRQQCDVMLHEVSEKLRAALGILSQPQHAKHPRNTVGK